MYGSRSVAASVVILLIPVLTSCAPKKVPAKLKVERIEPTEISNAERTGTKALPIAEIHSKFNLTSNDTFDAVISELERRSIKIAGADEPSGVINTKWVPIEDHMCERGVRGVAPLNCRVKFTFSIAPLTSRASSLVSRYVEICNFNEDVRVECPNSNAENLLREIVDEVVSHR